MNRSKRLKFIRVLIIVSARRHLVPTLCVGTHIPGHDKHGAPTQSVGARRHGSLAETMIKAVH